MNFPPLFKYQETILKKRKPHYYHTILGPSDLEKSKLLHKIDYTFKCVWDTKDTYLEKKYDVALFCKMRSEN